MSRVRTRPTRGHTRARLFEAAARIFEEHGIAASSIETVAAAAGLTRGAVYSNFANKEELIIAMLEDHAKRSLVYHHELLARHSHPADFIAALRATERGRRDPLGRAPLLHTELILYVARAGKRRSDLARRLRARRELIAEMVAGTTWAFGRGRIDPKWAGAMLLALEDGFRLHRLIDPDTTPSDSFIDSVAELQRLLVAPRRSSRRDTQSVSRAECLRP